MSSKITVLAYEVEHIPAVLEYLEAHPSAEVVSFTLWVERELRTRGVAVTPVTQYVPADEDAGPLMEVADTLAREWYRVPALSFFVHRTIRLGEVLEPMLSSYFQKVFYYLRALDRITSPGIERLVVPHSMRDAAATSGPLAPSEIRVVIDVATCVARARGIELDVLGTSPSTPEGHTRPRSIVRSLLLMLVNTAVGLLAKRKPLKIYASEYWWHVAPFIERMDDAEVVFMERKELGQIPWNEILKHRIRFLHPVDATTPAMVRLAEECCAAFSTDWKQSSDSVRDMPGFTYQGIAWWEVAEPAFTYLIETYAKRLITDSEAFATLFRKEGINRLLLRASLGLTQHHFFIAAQIARELSIPSIELQHATEIVDARSVHSRLSTDYLAAYGKATRDVLVRNHGYAPERIRAIGSPRFDSYTETHAAKEKNKETLQALGLDPEKPTLLYAVPSEIVDLYLANFDSYQIAHHFQVLREVQRSIPDLQIIAKFRGGALTKKYESYLHEVFGEDGIAYTDSRDVLSLMHASTLVLAGNSTLFLEALQAGRPTVLYPLHLHDRVTKMTYEHSIPAPESERELRTLVAHLVNDPSARDELGKKQKAFLKAGYSFDGRAAERTAELLREPLQVYQNEVL